MTGGNTTFEQAIAVEVAGDGHLVADVAEGWDVRGNPHGGYLLALTANAMRTAVSQPDPLSISATYLAGPRMGRADLYLTVLRSGKRQSTVSARLVQDDVERVHAVATFGTLSDDDPRQWASDIARSAIPDPGECLPAEEVIRAEGEDVRLHEHLLLRLHPRTGWVRGEPRGVADCEGWLAVADGHEPDPILLLMYSDGMPPSIFDAVGRTLGHVPTVQLTTHLFARPSPGWVQGRFRTRVQGGNFIDEDGELWDSTGRLVATTRQLALVSVEPRA